MDLTGQVIASTDGLHDNWSNTDFFKASLNKEVYISSPLKTNEQSDLYIYASAPLWKDGREGSEVLGIVAGTIKVTISPILLMTSLLARVEKPLSLIMKEPW